MTRHSQATVRACLAVIAGEGGLDLAGCANLGEEWNVVKKAYFKRVLVAHPDKGGDAEEFRNIQTSFEVLRDLYDGQRISSFAASVDHSTSKAFEDLWKDFEGAAPPSWDFYAEAAEEPVPLYRVELAKSGRSACNAKGAAKKCEESSISKDDIRVGWINPESGSYGRWVHLDCWRVPSRIWLGLPDPEECTDTSQFESALLRMNEVTFCGFSELDEQNKKKILAYIMDKGNWARITKRSTGSQEAAAATTTSSSSSPPAAAVHKTPSSSAEIVSASRQFFEVPVPGRNGAMPSALAGKTCVLTGVFPEVGGGKGLSLGKDRVKRMIESFGGRCTGSISGKTDILVVGKEPGFSKVSQARSKGTVQLLSIESLKQVCMGIALEAAEPAPTITNFSAGFSGNSLAKLASASEVAVARGVEVKQIADTSSSVPKPDMKQAPAYYTTKRTPPVTKEEENMLSAGTESGAVAPGKEMALQDSGEVKLEPKKTPAKKKPPAKKAPARKRKAETTSTAAMGELITCDGCGVNCTARSWHVERSGEDFCSKCHIGKVAVAQVNGITVQQEKGKTTKRGRH